MSALSIIRWQKRERGFVNSQNQPPYGESSRLNSPFYIHYLLCEQIKPICAPLFDYLNLDSFSYSRIHSSGHFLYISTHEKWMETFHKYSIYNNNEFQNDFYYIDNCDKEGTFLFMTSIEDKEDNFNKEGTFLYMGLPEKKEFLSYLYNAGVWNCLTLFLKNQDFTECWMFSSTPEEANVLNLYLNKPEIFKHFSTYFNREFQELIKVYDQEINAEIILSRSKLFLETRNERVHPRQDLEIQKYYLSGDLDEIYFSKRETECLYFLSKGNTIKEIAKTLTLSPRTVEVYIENAKIKTRLKSKKELLELFKKEGLKEALHLHYSRNQF